jgi:hypothetical protein
MVCSITVHHPRVSDPSLPVRRELGSFHVWPLAIANRNAAIPSRITWLLNPRCSAVVWRLDEMGNRPADPARALQPCIARGPKIQPPLSPRCLQEATYSRDRHRAIELSLVSVQRPIMAASLNPLSRLRFDTLSQCFGEDTAADAGSCHKNTPLEPTKHLANLIQFGQRIHRFLESRLNNNGKASSLSTL